MCINIYNPVTVYLLLNIFIKILKSNATILQQLYC